MKTVNVHATVNPDLCEGCKTCEMVCPVYAIKVKKRAKEIQIDIDTERCVGCWNCEQRCPVRAITMAPCEPRILGTDVSSVDYADIQTLCAKARFNPNQLVCYCTATRAEELAAAILAGAKTPDAVVLATGIGSGCGIECNQPIQRFLAAAGLTYERPEPGWQWYGKTVTAWEIDPEVIADHPVFRFEDDRKLLERIAGAEAPK